MVLWQSLTIATAVRTVLACGVLFSQVAHQPAELMYEHKSTWGGFLKREMHRRSANNLSVNDISLLKIAENDRKKERLAAVKTERTVRHCILFRQSMFMCAGS